MAALDDGLGTVGMNPRSDFVAIRAFAEDDPLQHDVIDMATAMRGIVYAADIRSDVLNMSFGWYLDRTGYTYDTAGTPDDPSDDVVMTPRDVAEVTRAFRRATDYAHDRGVVMVAGAGNDAVDFDQHPELSFVPASLPHVISVSATGPLGIANNPTTDLDVPAYYTNFGKSYIDLAAPGGNIDFDLQASGQLVTVFGITAPAWLLDFVFTTSEDQFPEEFPDVHVGPAFGTSLATPHVAGVAALIIEANGGRMDPDEVFSILRRTADDLGEPGKDAFYGHGRVNASAAVSRALAGRPGKSFAPAPSPARGSRSEPALPSDRPAPGGGSGVSAILPATAGAAPVLFGGTVIVAGGDPFSLPQLRPVFAAWDPDDPATYAAVRSKLVVTPDTASKDVLLGGSGTDWFWSDDPLDVLDITPGEVKN
jgi:subtilisin family serine protease